MPYTPSHQHGLGSSIVNAHEPLHIHPQNPHSLLLLRRLRFFSLHGRYIREEPHITARWSSHAPQSMSPDPDTRYFFQKRTLPEQWSWVEEYRLVLEMPAMMTGLFPGAPGTPYWKALSRLRKAATIAPDQKSVVEADRAFYEQA